MFSLVGWRGGGRKPSVAKCATISIVARGSARWRTVSKKMFVTGTWRTRGPDRFEEKRFRTPLGIGTVHLEERDGRGELALFVDVRTDEAYSHPGLYSAVGALAVSEIPRIEGSSATFRITAVPPAWLASPKSVVLLLSRAGLVSEIAGRTLVLRFDSGNISRNLQRAGLALFALDPFVRKVLPREDFLAVRSRTIREFNVPEFDELLDDHTGVRALRTLFDPSFSTDGPTQESEESPSRITARILSADTDEPQKIETILGRTIQVEHEAWKRAGETLAKWSVDPRWLFYLPAGISSAQSDSVTGPLEHPEMALEYYRNEKILKVLASFKHSGSRSIVIVCRTDAAAERRFGTREPGCIHTRTGRLFFENSRPMLESIREALTRAEFWKRFNTDWVCLDGEMLPRKTLHSWEGSREELLLSGEELIKAMREARDILGPEEAAHLDERAACFGRYRRLLERQRGKCAPGFAPLHIVATEGCSHFHETRLWQADILQGIVSKGGDPLLPTTHQLVSLDDKRSVEECLSWWEELSESGDEGLIIQPLLFVPPGRRGIAQPALLSRTPEHLRLVYGPDYDLPDNRWALKERPALRKRREKHRKVLKQLALSVEGVERFVERKSARDVWKCVRGVSSLES